MASTETDHEEKIDANPPPPRSNSTLMIGAKGKQKQNDEMLSLERADDLEQEQQEHLMSSTSTSATEGIKTASSRIMPSTAAAIDHRRMDTAEFPLRNVKQEELPTRTQLEPAGYYDAGWHHHDSKAEAQQGSHDDNIARSNNGIIAATPIPRKGEPQRREAIKEATSTGHIVDDESPIIHVQLPSTTNTTTEINPPWSTRGFQFTFARKRRSPGRQETNTNSSTTTPLTNQFSSATQNATFIPTTLKSYRAKWTSILQELCVGMKSNNNAQTNASNSAANLITNDHGLKKPNMKGVKKKLRDEFLSAITKLNQNTRGIDIENDTSVTGRYNTKRKYQPFGFVPSTEKACRGEQYEVFQSPASISYQYFEEHVLNVRPISTGELSDTKSNHQHYQSWNPRTMQYSSQPLHISQPFSQVPLTSSCSATAASRAALLSAMTNSGEEGNSSPFINNDRNPTPSSSSIMGGGSGGGGSGMNDQSINSDPIDDTHYRRDSGGDRFGRRHSLYMPSTTKSFDTTTNNHEYPFSNSPARESSISAQNLRRTFMGILNQDSNAAAPNQRPRDVSTTEAAEDLFHLSKSDNPNLLKGFGQPWTSSARSSRETGRYHQPGHHPYHDQSNVQQPESTHTSSRKKRKTTTPAKSKSKKKDKSSVRRSSRKKSKRNADEDSPAYLSGDEHTF